MPPHISIGPEEPSVQLSQLLGRFSSWRRKFLKMQDFLVLRVNMLLTMRKASMEAEISPCLTGMPLYDLVTHLVVHHWSMLGIYCAY